MFRQSWILLWYQERFKKTVNNLHFFNNAEIFLEDKPDRDSV